MCRHFTAEHLLATGTTVLRTDITVHHEVSGNIPAASDTSWSATTSEPSTVRLSPALTVTRFVGTQQYAVVACCSQHGQNVLCEIYEDCANAGNLLSCAFRTGLLRDTRDYRQVTGFRIIHTTIIADKITERPYHLFKYVFAVR